MRKSGDEALIKLTKELDGLDLISTGLIIDTDEIDEAINTITTDHDALKFAADRITAFHLKQMPDNFEYLDETEVKMGMRWSSVDLSVYVPGGTASYPSSVLMNAIPAKVAGVPRR